MIDYKNILYCTDFSEDAEIAFLHALDQTERHGATLHVLHCLQSGHRYNPVEVTEGQPPGQVADADDAMIKQAAKDLQERYESRLSGVGPVVWIIKIGTPYVEILRYLREQEIDLIVMGAEGASATEQTHYGSTVEQISARSPKPVMAVRNPEKAFTL